MDLAERGGGESLRFEIRKQLLGTLAELAADLLRDHRIVHRRHAVARGLEQIDRFDWHQVLARRKHLHQFHERAAQLGGTLDDAPGVADVRVEQFALVARGVEEGLAERGPQVAGADLRGEAAHLQRAARAPHVIDLFAFSVTVPRADPDPVNQRRGKGGAETIVDVHHGDSARACIEHPEQRRHPAERHP